MCDKNMLQCVVWKKSVLIANNKNRLLSLVRTNVNAMDDAQSVRCVNTGVHHTYISHSELGLNNHGGIVTSKTSLLLQTLQQYREFVTSVNSLLWMAQASIVLTILVTTLKKIPSWFIRLAMQYTEYTTKSLESRVDLFAA